MSSSWYHLVQELYTHTASKCDFVKMYTDKVVRILLHRTNK